MTFNMTQVYLDDDMLIRLDGVGDESVQKEVDKARLRKATKSALESLTDAQAQFCANAVDHANTDKIINLVGCYMEKCSVCGKQGEKWYHERNSRKKFGPRKGDYGGLRAFKGVDLDNGKYVSISKVACCTDCWEVLKPYVIESLSDVVAEVSPKLTGTFSKYKLTEKCECTVCRWTGTSYHLKEKPTLMGDATCRAVCPNCGAGEDFFSNAIERDYSRAGRVCVRMPDMPLNTIFSYQDEYTRKYHPEIRGLCVILGPGSTSAEYSAYLPTYAQTYRSKYRFALKEDNAVDLSHTHFLKCVGVLKEEGKPVFYWNGLEAVEWKETT